jgi:hypothetical protein
VTSDVAATNTRLGDLDDRVNALTDTIKEGAATLAEQASASTTAASLQAVTVAEDAARTERKVSVLYRRVDDLLSMRDDHHTQAAATEETAKSAAALATSEKIRADAREAAAVEAATAAAQHQAAIQTATTTHSTAIEDLSRKSKENYETNQRIQRDISDSKPQQEAALQLRVSKQDFRIAMDQQKQANTSVSASVAALEAHVGRLDETPSLKKLQARVARIEQQHAGPSVAELVTENQLREVAAGERDKISAHYTSLHNTNELARVKLESRVQSLADTVDQERRRTDNAEATLASLMPSLRDQGQPQPIKQQQQQQQQQQQSNKHLQFQQQPPSRRRSSSRRRRRRRSSSSSLGISRASRDNPSPGCILRSSSSRH